MVLQKPLRNLPRNNGRTFKKPEPLTYPNAKFRFKHYGQTIPEFIERALEMKDGEEKQALTDSVAQMMKKAYLLWNRDSVNDETILGQLDELSGGKLKVSENFEFESTRSILAQAPSRKSKGKPKGKSKGKKRNPRHKSQ